MTSLDHTAPRTWVSLFEFWFVGPTEPPKLGGFYLRTEKDITWMAQIVADFFGLPVESCDAGELLRGIDSAGWYTLGYFTSSGSLPVTPRGRGSSSSVSGIARRHHRAPTSYGSLQVIPSRRDVPLGVALFARYFDLVPRHELLWMSDRIELLLFGPDASRLILAETGDLE